jgi:hypothetical protein
MAIPNRGFERLDARKGVKPQVVAEPVIATREVEVDFYKCLTTGGADPDFMIEVGSEDESFTKDMKAKEYRAVQRTQEGHLVTVTIPFTSMQMVSHHRRKVRLKVDDTFTPSK